VLRALNAARVPYLVGGAYAFACVTGIRRDTKDLDIFIRRADYERLVAALRAAGCETVLTFAHWLAKVHDGDVYVDIIFNSGNGVCVVDDEWFAHACDAEVLGVPVRIPGVEDAIWSKAFIMERERFDGADVAHLLRARAATLDWPRLMQRFGAHWRVLLAHLVLFGFAYPDERSRVPASVMEALFERARREGHEPAPPRGVCAGTLLSREQYLHDIEQLGYADARVVPFGNMTQAQIDCWTDAIESRRSA
jgi:putative nucleotidyltransferase-like protein